MTEEERIAALRARQEAARRKMEAEGKLLTQGRKYLNSSQTNVSDTIYKARLTQERRVDSVVARLTRKG